MRQKRKTIPKVRNLLNMYFALIEVVSFSLNSLLFSSPSISSHLEMNDHEKTVNQGLNVPASRFNFLLFLSRCSDMV